MVPTASATDDAVEAHHCRARTRERKSSLPPGASGRPQSTTDAYAKPCPLGRHRGVTWRAATQLQINSVEYQITDRPASMEPACALAVNKFTAPTMIYVPRRGQIRAPKGHFSQPIPMFQAVACITDQQLLARITEAIALFLPWTWTKRREGDTGKQTRV